MRNGIWAKFKSAVSKSHEIPTISVFGIWKSRTFEFSLMILRFDALSWLPKSWCLKTSQHMMFFFIVACYFSRPSFGSAVCWLCNSTRSKALLDVLTRGLLIFDQCLNISFVFFWQVRYISEFNRMLMGSYVFVFRDCLLFFGSSWHCACSYY